MREKEKLIIGIQKRSLDVITIESTNLSVESMKNMLKLTSTVLPGASEVIIYDCGVKVVHLKNDNKKWESLI